MKLIRLDRWLEEFFAEPKPKLSDLQRNCRTGKIPAQKICKHWYVQVKSEYDLTPQAILPKSTGNPLVDRVLSATQ